MSRGRSRRRTEAREHETPLCVHHTGVIQHKVIGDVFGGDFSFLSNGYNWCVWDGASIGVRLVDAAITSYLEA
jgi:hypothetical protein